MAAGESPGLLCVGCGGSVGPLCDRSVIRRGRSRPTTVSPAHDDEDPGVRLLRGSVFLPADSEASGGRRGFPGTGSGESTGFPDDIGISETSFESAGRTVPAGTTAGFRGWSAEAGTSGFGREQSKRQRQQAQGDEVMEDGRAREAAAGGRVGTTEARGGRSSGRGGPLRELRLRP